MATPTGTISASDVNVELGRASNALFNLNDSAVRTLAGKSSGTIFFNDLRGKSNGFSGFFSLEWALYGSTYTCAYPRKLTGTTLPDASSVTCLLQTGNKTALTVFFKSTVPNGTYYLKAVGVGSYGSTPKYLAVKNSSTSLQVITADNVLFNTVAGEYWNGINETEISITPS